MEIDLTEAEVEALIAYANYRDHDTPEGVLDCLYRKGLIDVFDSHCHMDGWYVTALGEALVEKLETER